MYITISLSVLAVLSAILYFKLRTEYNVIQLMSIAMAERYRPAQEKEQVLLPLRERYRKLQADYARDLQLLKRDETTLAKYNLGVGTMDETPYQVSSSTTDVAALKIQLEEVKWQIKALVSAKSACICGYGNDVTVNGKKAEAKKLFNREIKLRIRCLDNEFKAATVLADWHNINRLTQHCRDTFDQINIAGEVVKTQLQKPYLALKITELRLSYEIKKLSDELKAQEREEKGLAREVTKEENKIEAARYKAEQERAMMEQLVAEELAKLASASDAQKQQLVAHQQALEILKEREQRAISLAQQTRAGYVYIISNVLSFGGEICKIGMTRRADPNERVKELGDASVPELFDVHAFIFTDDAPKLERYLHEQFSAQRVNLVNMRKEFFEVAPEFVLNTLQTYDDTYEITAIDGTDLKVNDEAVTLG